LAMALRKSLDLGLGLVNQVLDNNTAPRAAAAGANRPHRLTRTLNLN